jgi:hypothetical protein
VPIEVEVTDGQHERNPSQAVGVHSREAVGSISKQCSDRPSSAVRGHYVEPAIVVQVRENDVEGLQRGPEGLYGERAIPLASIDRDGSRITVDPDARQDDVEVAVLVDVTMESP